VRTGRLHGRKLLRIDTFVYLSYIQQSRYKPSPFSVGWSK